MSDDRSPDPLQALREWLDRSERRLNEILSEQSARDDVNAVRGRLSRLLLDLQKRNWEAWARYFQQINLPTRTDILGIGKRLKEIEEGIARIDRRLRALEQREASASPRPPAAGPGGARPRRTRQPPSAPVGDGP
jgi:hypothetical protein